MRKGEDEIVMRPAVQSDAGAIADVLIESRRANLPFAPSPHPPHRIREWVAGDLVPSGGVHVAEQGNTVVAVLAVSEDHETAWIDQMYVSPGYEGRGIGTKLLAYAHAFLPRPIRLYTFQANAGARRFYERFGYRVIETTDGRANEERCPDVLYELGESVED